MAPTAALCCDRRRYTDPRPLTSPQAIPRPCSMSGGLCNDPEGGSERLSAALRCVRWWMSFCDVARAARRRTTEGPVSRQGRAGRRGPEPGPIAVTAKHSQPTGEPTRRARPAERSSAAKSVGSDLAIAMSPTQSRDAGPQEDESIVPTAEAGRSRLGDCRTAIGDVGEQEQTPALRGGC